MSKRQCKYIKDNIAPPKSSDPTTKRPEHLNVTEAQEYDFKNNCKKMIEALREEMKNCLKEIEE